MKKIALAIILLGIVAFSIACVHASGIYLASQESIEASVGDEFTIRLFANPSSGYLWSVTGFSDDGPILLKENRMAPRNKNDERVGGSELEDWILRAQKPGTVTLRYSWARPWEDKPPVRVEEFKITVR